MGSNIDQLKAYSEACNTLRHYSHASLTVRLASVVQGIAILGAWAFAVTQKMSPLMIGFPAAGLFFTFLLYRFHLAYYRAALFFYAAAAKMEEKYFDEDCRPIATYIRKHEEMYDNIWGRAFTLNAPFAFIGTLFVLALFTTVWLLLFART